MNIIFVSDNLAKGKSITLTRRQITLLAIGWATLPILIAVALHYFMVSSTGSMPNGSNSSNPSYLQENLNTMGARLGQLQAKLLRLDALGGRLAKHFGLPEQEFDFRQQPGQGGPSPSTSQFQMDPQRLEQALASFEQQLEARSDRLGILEALTLREQVKKSAFPSLRPVGTGWFSSNFGWRIDPFTGKQGLHEGVDFVAEVGAPIKAAAGGVVVYSDYHTQYGNMVEIDHGNGLVTRYAHASKRLAKVGDVVLQGQTIAQVGSTGRSTGAHLHFEVLSNGVPQNPSRYLQIAG